MSAFAAEMREGSPDAVRGLLKRGLAVEVFTVTEADAKSWDFGVTDASPNPPSKAERGRRAAFPLHRSARCWSR
jgi:hypothetical protein